VETILTIAAMPVVAAAVATAAYEADLLAGRDTTMGRWVRHLMVGPQSGGTALPALKLIAVMLVYAAVAITLAPLVIAAEPLVLARRRHRGEVIGPAPWPRGNQPGTETAMNAAASPAHGSGQGPGRCGLPGDLAHSQPRQPNPHERRSA
jgi:hypothetical protein